MDIVASCLSHCGFSAKNRVCKVGEIISLTSNAKTNRCIAAHSSNPVQVITIVDEDCKSFKSIRDNQCLICVSLQINVIIEL